jgi:Trp operon repressor
MGLEMPKHEEIVKAVTARRKIKPWVESRVEGLSKLPERARAIGHLLIGHSEKQKERPDRMQLHRMRERGGAHLLGLSDEEQLGLGKTLLPQIADVFEAAWHLHERLPLQVGWMRKPFRAPGRPDLLRGMRAAFLSRLAQDLEGLDEDLIWLAAHAPHVTEYLPLEAEIGLLLAAGIDGGGKRADEIREVLRASADGTHEVGQFGRHLIAGFLCSADRDGWEYIGKLLLAAQRQEGLRQAILESADFAHPDAFRHILRVILDNNLTRFSATVRAADVWLGLQLDSQSAGYVNDTLETLATYLDDAKLRAKALAGDDAEKAFIALWSVGFDDGPAAVKPSAALLKHRKPEMRFMGVHMLGMLSMRDAYEPLLPAVDDGDLRVAAYAAVAGGVELERRMRLECPPGKEDTDADEAEALPVWEQFTRRRRYNPAAETGDFFERLTRLHGRIPAKPKDLKPLVWPWLRVEASRQIAADAMIAALGPRPVSLLLPYLHDMSPSNRERVAEILGAEAKPDEASRRALLQLVGDASASVREEAVRAMQKLKIAADDVPLLEPLLSRKASDLRRGVLALILSAKDDAVLASAERLTGAKAAPVRLAGLDLLSQMLEKNRGVAKVRAMADGYKSARTKLDRDEQVYLEKLLGAERSELTLENALGLMDPAKRTPSTKPQKRDVKLATPAASKLLELLDAAVQRHREAPVSVCVGDVQREPEPLGSIRYWFPTPFNHRRRDGDGELRPLDDLPLKDVWLDVWRTRSEVARGADGLDAARALLICSIMEEGRAERRSGWRADLWKELIGTSKPVKYTTVVSGVLKWLVAYETKGDLATFVVDGFERLLAALPFEKLTEKGRWRELQFREIIGEASVLTGDLRSQSRRAKQWTDEHQRRWFGLRRWTDEPGAAVGRDRMDWAEIVASFEAAAANEHDVYDNLLGPRPEDSGYVSSEFLSLGAASEALRKRELSPGAAGLVERSIARVLEIELARGESRTPASQATLALKQAGGMELLVRVLQAIGRDPKLQRTHSWSTANTSKSAVFSHLIRTTVPGPEETPARFAQSMKATEISEDLLLAVAMYAPQWVRHIEAAIGWEMLAEAVWWLHAHTKDSNWRVDAEIRDGWNAEIRKLTPLSLEDLVEGAVDVQWFERVHKALDEKRWARLDEFAKYASGGGGHKRAQLFAQAMLGEVKKTALVKEIGSKRKQDAVRALGLLPLEKKSEKADVLARYKVIQEFVRGSRRFGSQRQASEKLAARIGQENLARTAAYPDPIRLQWAMEGLATADLAKGPEVAKVKDVSVQLAIDADGLPEISVTRGDKPLKSIPPEAKKNAAVQELTERKTELRRSASRMRQSLEQAMCRGDRFSGEELKELMGNVILRPMLDRLVFVGAGVLGYPVDGGKGLHDYRAKIEPVKKGKSLRLAHPTDLLATKNWSDWQRECFAAERVQPFKQVFRELYVLTQQEKSDGMFSRRYAGQQVNPRQAMALLGSRGWVAAPEAGVFRTFHDEKLVAWIEFMETFFTPADVEGLTVEKLRFAKRAADEALKLTDVPPRLLSETMRDVDLVVSVAHRGAVNPEASASTVELRSALLRETVQLLKLDNVRIKEPLVHIRGTRGEYSVHLGSATTHMLPGGALFIVPVHSQHRGRIFLPFADDDPKTAEILSKVLLLARDAEIRDPNLLEQMRVAGG